MAPQRLNNVTIEGARLLFRNFSGKEGRYNREGDRNFNVVLPEKVALDMQNDGWNIKWLKPREVDPGEDEVSDPILPVKLNYRGRPPRVVLITSRGRTELGEDEVGLLDYADVINTDLIVRPYEWDINGRQGVTAYAQSVYVTIREDELELKYAEVERMTSSPKGESE